MRPEMWFYYKRVLLHVGKVKRRRQNITPSSSLAAHCLILPCALVDGNLGMDFIEAVSGEGQEGSRRG